MVSTQFNILGLGLLDLLNSVDFDMQDVGM